MRGIRKAPAWANAMVGNWRRVASLPDEINDDAIFTVVDGRGAVLLQR